METYVLLGGLKQVRHELLGEPYGFILKENIQFERSIPDGLKITTLLASSVRSSPVCGLRPRRGFLSLTLNFPNPLNRRSFNESAFRQFQAPKCCWIYRIDDKLATSLTLGAFAIRAMLFTSANMSTPKIFPDLCVRSLMIL